MQAILLITARAIHALKTPVRLLTLVIDAERSEESTKGEQPHIRALTTCVFALSNLFLASLEDTRLPLPCGSKKRRGWW
jgi:hypothetical protein